MSVYRVQLQHVDAEHPNGEASHVGPAFDDFYAGQAAAILGVDHIDLLQSARAYADRIRLEHPDGDGWTVSVVELIDNGDDTSSWQEVS